MGFSLKMLFEELQDILDDPFLTDSAIVNYIKELIVKEKQYAKDCGQLK